MTERTIEVTDIDTDAQLLRLAVQQLATASQAQRRTLQLGHLPRAVANLQRIAADLQALRQAGVFDDEQLALVAALRDEVSARSDADPAFIPREGVDGRDFLFTSALETPEWHHLRLTARRAYHAIAGDQSPFIAIMAK
jgi:hypothetical protein